MDADPPAKLVTVTRRRASYVAAAHAQLKRDFLKRARPARPGTPQVSEDPS